MAQRKKEVAWMNMGPLKVKIEVVYRNLEKKKLMGFSGLGEICI